MAARLKLALQEGQGGVDEVAGVGGRPGLGDGGLNVSLGSEDDDAELIRVLCPEERESGGAGKKEEEAVVGEEEEEEEDFIRDLCLEERECAGGDEGKEEQENEESIDKAQSRFLSIFGL